MTKVTDLAVEVETTTRRQAILRLALLVAEGAPAWRELILYMPDGGIWTHGPQINLRFSTIAQAQAFAGLVGAEQSNDIWTCPQWCGWFVVIAAVEKSEPAPVEADAAAILDAALKAEVSA